MKRVAGLILCLCSITTIQAQNWSSFRGNNASGVAEGRKTAATWNVDKSQNIVWKTSIPGLSHASPIIWGNRVYVITAISSDSSTGFVAKDRGIGLAEDSVKHTWKIFSLDKKSGEVIWSQTAYEGIPRAKRHVKATQANSTPVTDGRYVVALFGSEGLACYDLNGKLVWEKDLGVQMKMRLQFGEGTAPVLDRDRIILTFDHEAGSFIVALDKRTGKELWRTERAEPSSWSTPLIIDHAGRRRHPADPDRGQHRPDFR